jgi:hypothetical protein
MGPVPMTSQDSPRDRGSRLADAFLGQRLTGAPAPIPHAALSELRRGPAAQPCGLWTRDPVGLAADIPLGHKVRHPAPIPRPFAGTHALQGVEAVEPPQERPHRLVRLFFKYRYFLLIGAACSLADDAGGIAPEEQPHPDTHEFFAVPEVLWKFFPFHTTHCEFGAPFFDIRRR